MFCFVFFVDAWGSTFKSLIIENPWVRLQVWSNRNGGGTRASLFPGFAGFTWKGPSELGNSAGRWVWIFQCEIPWEVYLP